jgi:uncharacterized protein (UPF0335 family)
MTDVGGIASERLKSFIERIERLEEEKSGISGDIKSVYDEAKSTGFETKIMKEIIKRRKKDRKTLQEEDALLEVYQRALGMYNEGEDPEE